MYNVSFSSVLYAPRKFDATRHLVNEKFTELIVLRRVVIVTQTFKGQTTVFAKVKIYRRFFPNVKT